MGSCLPEHHDTATPDGSRHARASNLPRVEKGFAATTTPVKSAKSVVTQAAAPLPETKTPLPGAPKTFITTAPEEDTEIKSVYEYFIGLKILMFAWTYVGHVVAESKREQGAKVIVMCLSAACNYADDAYDCAMKAVTSDRLRWLRDRDWATRSRMTELLRAPYNWPAVEALDKALDEYRNQWYPGELRSVDGDGKEVKNSQSESGR